MLFLRKKEQKMIEQRSIENLLNSIDIVDLIGSYVSLKKSGSSWVGLCPFHSDNTPSMHVSQAKGFYHCFACGAGGNAIKFVMEIDKLNYPQAIEKIADMYGFSLSYTNKNTQKKDNSSKEILNLLNNFYKRELFSPANKAALAYLKERKISDAMIERFELGWAPASVNSINLLKNEKIEAKLALRCGAIKHNENGIYASFSNRITFPIFNHIGVIVGFGGRTISDHPAKYINSPQSEVFDKSRILYGYDKAKTAIFRAKEMIICEGYMDCIMLHEAGFDNAVAVLGTALTPKHLPLINKENIKVILSFDSDNAGQSAALRSAELLSRASIDGRVVLIEGGKDPAELVANGKADELRELYKGGIEFVEFVLRKKVEQNPINTPLEKARALDELRAYLGSLRAEIVGFYEPLVSSLVGIDISHLRGKNMPNSRFAPFVPNSAKSYQNAPYSRQNIIQNLPSNSNIRKDILALSVLKNMLMNREYRAYGIPLINEEMFLEPRYYHAFMSGADEGLLRELELDDSLENYTPKQFEAAIKRLLCAFLEAQISKITNSNEENKLNKIKQIRNTITILKKEINDLTSTI